MYSKAKRVLTVAIILGVLAYLMIIHMGAGLTLQDLTTKEGYDRVVAVDGTVTLGDRSQVKAINYNPPTYRLQGIVYMIPPSGEGFTRQLIDVVYDSDHHEIAKHILEVRVFYPNGMVNIPATLMAEGKLEKPIVRTNPGSADYASGVALFWANYKVDFLGTWE